MTGPLLRWVARHEPDAYRQACWALLPKDSVRHRLTGAAATDPVSCLRDPAVGSSRQPVGPSGRPSSVVTEPSEALSEQLSDRWSVDLSHDHSYP
jgi:hypothetical protein